MKDLNKIYLILLLTIFASCKKQLNVFPTTQEVDGNVIIDQQSAETVLNGVYYLFANAGFDYNQSPSILWCDVNESIPSKLSGLFTYPYGGSSYSDHIYDANTSGIGVIWVYGYKVVNAANGFLKNIDPVNNIIPEQKKKLMAQAKFLRAYANATLLFYYGQYNDVSSNYGILLRRTFVTPNDMALPRSTVKDSYDFILTDVDSAIEGLEGVEIPNYYASKWAAKLLKARILMARGLASDYTEVASICADIIAHSPYALEKDSKELFLTKGLTSNEVILGIKPYGNDIYKYNEYLYFYEQTGSDLMIQLFNNDPRNTWVYQLVPDPYNAGKNINVVTKYYPGSAGNPSPTAQSNVSYALRLTEAYLLQSEAITASGGDLNKAKDLLKIVLKSAGYTSFESVDAAITPSSLQLLIIKEEMKNFMGEAGADWLALRRLPFSEIQTLVPTIKSKTQLILPIPQEEMQRNPAFKGMQNPGY